MVFILLISTVKYHGIVTQVVFVKDFLIISDLTEKSQEYYRELAYTLYSVSYYITMVNLSHIMSQ